ncbi:MAG: hypothetical protein JKY56_15165 [Kofleriaceae bacterium]|nr:hypothetical protein [Kofleriaceae bacterium]
MKTATSLRGSLALGAGHAQTEHAETLECVCSGLSKQAKSAGLLKERSSGAGDILGQLSGMIDVKDAASILVKLFWGNS